MTLADQAARDLIATALDTTLFVEAGAGTGKTTALVGRLANLITESLMPVEMREIVAITFTEKAAAELRDRLRQELEKRVRQGGRGSDRAATALDTLDEAAIGTIHAFARSLLARYAVEAGLPPGFTLLDEAQSALRREAWWQETKEGLLSDPMLEKAWGHALDQELTLNKFRGVALACAALGEDSIYAPFDETGSQVMGRYRQLLERGKQLVQFLKSCSDEEDKLAVGIRAVQNWLGWAEPLPDGAMSLDGVVEALTYLPPKPRANSGAKGKWQIDVAEPRERCAAFFEEAAEVAAEARLIRVAPILNFIAGAARDERYRRIEEGMLEFDDLLSVSCHLLRTQEDVRTQLFGRIRCLLVDEFQDTDPKQVELVMRLTALNGAGKQFRWTEAEVPGGRLFFVGDPKQSIYRFRGADVTVYETVRNSLDAKVANLTVNFRSTQGVLRVVNQIFGTLFPSQVGQATYVNLDPPPQSVDCGPRVLGFGGPVPKNRIRSSESEDLAERVASGIRGKEPWQVGNRPARYGDVTILFPTRSSLPALERALQANEIPYRIDSQSMLYESQEFRDLSNLATAIEDPTDEVAVVATLRSPVFAITDPELQLHRGGWDPRQIREGGTRVERAMQSLAMWHADRERPVAELIDLVMRERHLLESAASEPRPRDIWRRYGLFLEHARKYDQSTHGPLRGFLVWLRALQNRETRSLESVLAEDDDDAVRLMTIHASKGLEFPIVAVVGLGGQTTDAAPVKAWAAKGRIDLYIDEKHYSFGAATQRENDKNLEALEADRLLYVAFTRARQDLLISLYGPERKTDNFVKRPAERVREALPASLCRDPLATVPLAPPPPSHKPPLLADLVAQNREAWRNRRAVALAGATPARTWAPTALAKAVAAWRTGEPTTAYGSSRPTGGPDLGRAVHTVLQTIDLGAPLNSDFTQRMIAGQAAAERQPLVYVSRLVGAALESPVVQAVAGGEHWREVFASTRLEGVLIEGYIDLIGRLPDGRVVLVDYKTDAVTTESEVRHRMRIYGYQAAVYALLLEAHLGARIAQAHFLFLNAPAVKETAVANLAEAMEEVCAFLRGPASDVTDRATEDEEEVWASE